MAQQARESRCELGTNRRVVNTRGTVVITDLDLRARLDQQTKLRVSNVLEKNITVLT